MFKYWSIIFIVYFLTCPAWRFLYKFCLAHIVLKYTPLAKCNLRIDHILCHLQYLAVPMFSTLSNCVVTTLFFWNNEYIYCFWRKCFHLENVLKYHFMVCWNFKYKWNLLIKSHNKHWDVCMIIDVACKSLGDLMSPEMYYGKYMIKGWLKTLVNKI